MPNYCTNSVRVKAEPRNIAIIVSAIKWKWLFESLIPQDTETILDGILEEYYGYLHRDCSKGWEPHIWQDDWFEECPYKQKWYNFRIKNWWSKRDVEQWIVLYMDYNIQEWRLEVDYDSAWSPQLEWRKYVSKLLKAEVYIEYSEPWMNFSWRQRINNWKITEDTFFNDDAYYWHWKECPTCWSFHDDENPDDWTNEEHTKCIWCEED